MCYLNSIKTMLLTNYWPYALISSLKCTKSHRNLLTKDQDNIIFKRYPHFRSEIPSPTNRLVIYRVMFLCKVRSANLAAMEANQPEEKYGCEHYERKCAFVVSKVAHTQSIKHFFLQNVSHLVTNYKHIPDITESCIIAHKNFIVHIQLFFVLTPPPASMASRDTTLYSHPNPPPPTPRGKVTPVNNSNSGPHRPQYSTRQAITCMTCAEKGPKI